MAFRKTLVQRLFNLSRFSTPRTSAGKPPSKIKPPSQHRPLYQSAALAPPLLRLFPPAPENLISFPAPEYPGLTVTDLRKLLRASQVDMIRGKLSEIRRDWVSYEEFVEIMKENCGGNKEQALEFTKTLDACGSVIVLGDSVCLRPHQVAKAIQNLVKPSKPDPDDPRRQELELMVEQKAEIDRKAEALVRRELWAGLGFMVAQTAAFMRLTFWELSWDVMEPICFYVTSLYFMLGYAFFLRTSKEPSFEGFFQSRFCAKQKRLMKSLSFDLERFNELSRAFYPRCSSSSLDATKMIKFDHHKID